MLEKWNQGSKGKLRCQLHKRPAMGKPLFEAP
jgi:hypothetical protein